MVFLSRSWLVRTAGPYSKLSYTSDMEIQDKELHRIAITCIIYNEEGKYLLTKRSPTKKAHPNKWTVPGGGLNVDDYVRRPQTHGDAGWYGSVEEALHREVKEEVNIVIGKATYLLDLTFIRPDGIPVLVLSYYAPYVSGEVILDEDAVEYQWASLAEAKELDLISGIYEELEEVEKLLRKDRN